MSQVAAFKSAILRNTLTTLSASSFSTSFPSDDIPLIPCTIVADTNAGVIDINSTAVGLYSINSVEIQSAAFDITDFILKYADISDGSIQLTTTGGWSASNVVVADRDIIAARIFTTLV
jgi:hypothetical protein